MNTLYSNVLPKIAVVHQLILTYIFIYIFVPI